MTTPPARAAVLLVDDDEALTALLIELLGRFGLAARAAATPEEGLRLLRGQPPDIVILDVMLPGMDGFEVCRRIREISRVPIIMLTARGDVTDRIVGLELGADDYLPKPFEPRELVARIQAVLRRGQHPEGAERVRIGSLEVDGLERWARLGGRLLELTTAELDLLLLLVRNHRRVLTRDRIMEHTRGGECAAFDRSIDVLVSRLRAKLGDDARKPRFIKTVHGAGYTFIGDGDA
jgi:two-component system phosphate regulon response regulator OmpR